MKTQTRIAIVFFLVTLTIMIGLSGSIYYFVINYTFTDFYKRLETRAVITARIMIETESSSATAFQEMRERILEKLPQEKDYLFKINPDQTFEEESKRSGLPITFFKNILDGKKSQYQQGNIFYSGIRFEKNKEIFIIVISAENYYYSHHFANFRKILVVVIISLSLLVLYISIVFSRYVFNPIRQITAQVKEISSQNLHLRLEASAENDAVNELKNTFNNMLDRLETSFDTQKNFISNASHELGTPLTTIIGEADVALSKIRKPEDYRESLAIILTKAEQLDRITKLLLFLAQTGFDGIKQKFENVRIDQLLWDVKGIIDEMNAKNKVHISLELLPENPEKLKIQGNKQLLNLALSNLVNNACKYSNHQPVLLSIGISDLHIIIIIKDSGIGIPEDELKYIYDPFFRASNSKDFEGYGIGLPLTRNIVRMHKGEINVSSILDEGTIVEVVFPISTVFPK